MMNLSLKYNLKKYWHWIIETVFPAFCLACKVEGSFLCNNCLKGVNPLQQQICPICMKIPNKNGSTCENCLGKSSLDGVFVASEYERSGTLARAIHNLKYDFVEDLAEPLGMLLYESWVNFGKEEMVICPLPLHKKRLNWRGFNQTELITNKFLAKLQNATGAKMAMRQFLYRQKFDRPQMELAKDQRKINMQNAFEVLPQVKSEIQGMTILLVDDVATTLATLEAAAKVLKSASAKKVFAVVLARVYLNDTS